MKAFLIYLLIIPLIFNGDLFSQNNRYNKELPLLITKNQEFDSIITDIVCCLKKCSYYSKAIVFSITIVEKNDSIFIDIAANHDPKVVLTDRYWKPYGYFLCSEHLFFVFCDNLPNIFEIAKTKKMFVINDAIDILLIADYPEWLYLYTSNKFVLKKLVNECGNK